MKAFTIFERAGAAAFLVLSFFAVGCDEASDPETPLANLDALAAQAAPGSVYEQVCTVCHGPGGEGKEELFSPSIAGLPAWYIEEQIGKFRTGQRGFHPDDAPGQVMRGIALTLTEAQIREAAATVAAMPPVLTDPPPSGIDILPGRRLYARACMECHRFNGTGEATFHSAPLVILDPAYLRRQLENYRAGRRGATEGDIYGAKMVQVASRLSDEDIDHLVHYIGALAHGDDPRSEMER